MQALIRDPDHFEKLGKIFKNEGKSKIHILADFDGTLTYLTINGIKTPSIISLLRDGNHLSPDYAQKAHALYNHYQPIEIDETIPLTQRKKAMQEWRDKHIALLIESGLSISDLQDIAINGHLKFREGVANFLDLINAMNIPLVVMSASGCGDVIPMFFSHNNQNHPNQYFISNFFNWDEHGKAVSHSAQIIHSLNKDETILAEFTNIYNIVKERKNVILLGDNIGDLGMVEGFDYDNLITIGFLNSDSESKRLLYLNKFDLVLEGDGDFDNIHKLMMKIV